MLDRVESFFKVGIGNYDSVFVFSLWSVTSSQVISMAADLQLACVLGLCHTVNWKCCIFAGCIITFSLEAEICEFMALGAGWARVISHPEMCAM